MIHTAPLLHALTVAAMSALLLAIVWLMRRQRFSLREGLSWLLTSVIGLVFALVPETMGATMRWLGFEVPSNGLFALALAFIVLNVLVTFVVVSNQGTQLRRLAQELALVKGELETLRRERQRRDDSVPT